MNNLVEILGYFGMFLCLSAYTLNVLGKVSSDSLYYLLANGFGGAFLVLNSYYHWAFPSAIENAVWASIAFLGLLKRKKQHIENK
jgi:hypothetical protein